MFRIWKKSLPEEISADHTNYGRKISSKKSDERFRGSTRSQDGSMSRDFDTESRESRECVSYSGMSTFTKQTTDNRQMKVVYKQFSASAADVLELVTEPEFDRPESADHVVIKVQACTVTVNDCIVRRGFCFDILNPVALPVTPGTDVVGHVVALGSNVKDFRVGERVAALVRSGANSRFIPVHQNRLVKVPRSLDAGEAAAMVSIYTTAYQALKLVSQDGPMFSLEGKKVLINGGIDGVGQALAQMCNKAQATVLLTAPQDQHTFIRNVLNATPLPMSSKEWLPSVQGTMDIVFDGMCEDGLETPFKALHSRGELICFGHASMLNEKEIGLLGAPMSAHVNRLWSQRWPRTKILDISESFERDPEAYKKNLRSLYQLLKWDKIRPMVVKRVALSEVASSQRQFEHGEIHGVVVCLPWKRVALRRIGAEYEERDF